MIFPYTSCLGVIQIIRDTRRGPGGGVNEMSLSLFWLFEMYFLMHREEKLFVTGQDNASKDTFFLIHLVFQRNLGLKIAD